MKLMDISRSLRCALIIQGVRLFPFADVMVDVVHVKVSEYLSVTFECNFSWLVTAWWIVEVDEDPNAYDNLRRKDGELVTLFKQRKGRVRQENQKPNL